MSLRLEDLFLDVAQVGRPRPVLIPLCDSGWKVLSPNSKSIYFFVIQRRDALRGAGEEFNKIADVVSRQVIIIIFRVIRFIVQFTLLSPKDAELALAGMPSTTRG